MTSPDTAGPILLLEKVSANVDGRAALKDVTLSVSAGEIHALVGSQGSGKSTLVKVIAGLVPRTSGRIVFDGRNIYDPPRVMEAGFEYVGMGRRVPK